MGHPAIRLFSSMVRVIVRSAARRDVTIYAFSPAVIGNQTEMHRPFAALRVTLARVEVGVSF
jgi:hypothetical protein